MKDNKTTRILNLLLFLGNKPNSSKKEILEELQLDERTFFNYLREIRESGFLLKCKSGKYFLDKTNDNVKNFSEIINFSSEEEYLIASAIDSLNISKNKKNKLYSKVNFIYNSSIPKLVTNSRIQKLTKAIQNKNQVIIQGYNGNNSSLSTFQCEVYAIDNETHFCWCYISSTNKNTKLKINDISKVIISPIKWIFTDNHLKIACDSFGVNGLRNLDINILFDSCGATSLINQYPMSEKEIIKIDHNLYKFETSVCDYNPITRFILFNLENIKQIEPIELRTYISEWLDEKSTTFSEKKYVL